MVSSDGLCGEVEFTMGPNSVVLTIHQPSFSQKGFQKVGQHKTQRSW